MWHLQWLFLVLLPRLSLGEDDSLETHQHETDWKILEKEHVPHYKDRIGKFGKKAATNNPEKYVSQYLKRKRPAQLTPDWTAEEIPPEIKSNKYYGEFERPYRLQPMTPAANFWESSPGNIDREDLRGILGAWYDITAELSNTSVYMTPARIHYHPKYIMPEIVNASHPIPAVFDLAVWASEYPLYYNRHISGISQAYICNRAGSHWLQFGSPVLGSVKQPVAIIVGFQFIMWWKRKPTPFHKYAVKTQKYTGKCPKTEWGWFFCVWGKWAVHGLESGAALHRATQGQSWLYDGLLGLNSFSSDLRAKEMTHYFTPVENHSVLSWLYDAYMGRQDYRYLDYRFENSEWQAPRPKNGVFIKWAYNFHPWHWFRHHYTIFDEPIYYK